MYLEVCLHKETDSRLCDVKGNGVVVVGGIPVVMLGGPKTLSLSLTVSPVIKKKERTKKKRRVKKK